MEVAWELLPLGSSEGLQSCETGRPQVDALIVFDGVSAMGLLFSTVGSGPGSVACPSHRTQADPGRGPRQPGQT